MSLEVFSSILPAVSQIHTSVLVNSKVVSIEYVQYAQESSKTCKIAGNFKQAYPLRGGKPKFCSDNRMFGLLAMYRYEWMQWRK